MYMIFFRPLAGTCPLLGKLNPCVTALHPLHCPKVTNMVAKKGERECKN